jgi:hypothetical protein
MISWRDQRTSIIPEGKNGNKNATKQNKTKQKKTQT